MSSIDMPWLSMCIPTYNRAAFLRKTLDCIVTQRIFVETDLIEVVISDNHSTDDTEAVALEYQKRFPQKIRYVRTEEPVFSALNFANALLHAQGKLCKLHNDSISVFPGFLEAAIELIRNNFDETYAIFFRNGSPLCPVGTSLCASMDDFVSYASIHMTWIGGFAIWKKDIPEYIHYFTERSHHFAQTEILLALLERGRTIVLYNEKFGEEYPGVTKAVTTKFLEEVYLGEYPLLLKRYVDSTLLRREIYAREVQRLIVLHYIPNYYGLKKRFHLSFVQDFAFLKNYVPLCRYYAILCMYPLYAYIYYPYIRRAKSRMPKTLLNMLYGASSFVGRGFRR